jgi:DNA-binding transcriptional LysR family regulator
MRIQTGQLDAVRWIGRLGSFRAAAARLNLSQPTISMRVRELERHLGATLFDRSGYRAQLTEAGRELVRYAERILSLAEEMEQHSTRAPQVTGPIRLGAADSFALTCLPALLAQLEQAFPALRVDLQIDFSSNLNQRLQRGELDMAFLTGPVAGPGLEVASLVRLPLAWVTGPRIALPARLLRPDDLRNRAILTNPRPSHLFRSVQAWFASSGAQPARLMTCNSLTIMARLAAAGFGISLLPTGLLRTEFELGNLRRLRTDPPVDAHEMLMASRKSLPESVVAAIRDTARRLVQASDLALQ